MLGKENGMPIGRLAARVRDRRAEAQSYKGMSQTKVKSRMYASKLLTERSPVAKRVMIAEADADAPKSFCDAPDGTGHRDMARFLNRKSQRYYRLKFADTYYGEVTRSLLDM